MNKIINIKSILLLFLCISVLSCSEKKDDIIDLSGSWKVTVDAQTAEITLPGSLAENKIGKEVVDSITTMLSEPYTYTGNAVYEKEINIPLAWENKLVELFIERTKVSRLFVNGEEVGSQSFVSAPHRYRIQNLKAGTSHFRIEVDNTKSLLPLGGAHAYSEHTQTNWNGILGDFYLKKLPVAFIRTVRIEPSVSGDCRLTIEIENTGNSENFPLEINIYDPQEKKVLAEKKNIEIIPGISSHVMDISIPDPVLWGEFTTSLYTLKIKTENNTHEESFGINHFATQVTQFINNGQIVFLRGTHEGGVFPLTGYPSMQKKDWERNLQILKSYGINHVRFHSWCPPKAAFEAADEVGIFLQPELPLWGQYTATDTNMVDYMKKEGEAIMNEYGNHPSFSLFALGNELIGDTAVMADVVNHLRNFDDRHLYALGSNNFYWDPQTHPTEDFFVAMRHGKEAEDYSTDLRGSFSFADSNEGGIINKMKPDTERDFSQAISGLDKPVVGHENGQYQVFPNLKEQSKYTGVMQARNFAVFEKRLKEAGLSSLADYYVKSSGALAALCYKEEIEMSLRTPNFGGFQLLDIQDYPGQGTALVGILDAFMDSKDVISQEKWTEFCNDVVPLARFPKFVWNNNETFSAEIQIANYGLAGISHQNLICRLEKESGEIVYERIYENQSFPQGKLSSLSPVEINLSKIKDASKLILSISLENTSYNNTWNIWVYPSDDSPIKEGFINGVYVTRDLKEFEELCRKGAPTLLIPRTEDLKDISVGGLFTTDFWNYTVFKNVAESMKKEASPGTMGLLITHPAHDALRGFPTDFHTDWQWWNIVKNSHPVILDKIPYQVHPIVRVIDNFDRNSKLGLIFEVGGTKGLVCSADLFSCSDEPEVRALFKSLIDYLSKNK